MVEHELLVVVTTPEGKVYNHRSYSVSADAVDGGITILPHHAPIMLPLKIGALRVKRFLEDSPTDYIAIGGGVMEVRDNVVTIIANVAERERHFRYLFPTPKIGKKLFGVSNLLVEVDEEERFL